MPRGRKKLTLEEQLAKVTTDIEATQNAIDQLKAEKKELEEEIKFNQVSELNEFMTSKGLSIDDVKSLLENNETEEN